MANRDAVKRQAFPSGSARDAEKTSGFRRDLIEEIRQ